MACMHSQAQLIPDMGFSSPRVEYDGFRLEDRVDNADFDIGTGLMRCHKRPDAPWRSLNLTRRQVGRQQDDLSCKLNVNQHQNRGRCMR
ncbi:unnamed protein product, partial [Clonostachys byssicola]